MMSLARTNKLHRSLQHLRVKPHGAIWKASDTDMLCALEGLLKEFYAHNTDNARKKDIEIMLSNFGQQTNAWKHCIYFIRHARDEYVLMYSLNVLETVVSQQWTNLNSEDRLHVRLTVYQLLLVGHSTVSAFLRNKMAKLITYVARQDWPHDYPDFFSNILMLISHPDTIVLGLILLQTASEELACPRNDLIASRKEELHQLMLKQVSTVLILLNDVLEMVLSKPRVILQTESGSSPLHHSNSQPSDSQHGLLRKSADNKATIGSTRLSVLDTQSTIIAQLTLSCLSHLFSWIPMLSTSESPPSLFKNIFQFASFGCQPLTLTANTEIVSEQCQLSDTAMSCINELLGKTHVPSDCDHFLLTVFSQTYSILQCLTGDSRLRLNQLSSSYVDKFTEFLQLFVSLHLKRYETNSQFPMMDFLSLLFKFTLKQSCNDGFYNCLHVWTEFLDYVAQKMEDRACVKGNYLARYQEALVSLATEVLHKLQFRFNQSQLEELDDDVLDDDCKTEWQYFLSESLEIIARVAQLYPNHIFILLSSAFHENLEVYIGLEQYINTDTEAALNGNHSNSSNSTTDATISQKNQRRLCITAENDCRRLHCALRDLSSLLQALGRLADHFTGEENFSATFNDGYLLIDKLLRTAVYGTRVRLYDTRCAIEDVLKPDFTEVHAQSLAVVKAYSMWLTQFYVQTRRDVNNTAASAQCDTMIANALEATLPLLTSNQHVPEKVLISCAHLLVSLLTGVRPAHLYNFPALQRLYADGLKVHNCPLEVELLVMRALSHYLMLPWSGGLPDSEQDWPERAARLTLLFQRNFHDYTMLAKHLASPSPIDYHIETSASLSQGKICLQRALSIMTDIVDALGVDGVSRSKQICYTALCDYIDTASQLLTVYLRHTDVVDQLLGFFLAAFRCLRVQMGLRVTEKLIQMLMGLFTREQLLLSLQQETASGHQLIDKFLKILQVIVLEPNASFKAFLPSILDLCLNQVYPILAERASPDVKPTLYELLFQFLQYNWRYFFRTSVMNTIGNKPTSAADCSVQSQEIRQQFVAIIRAFGQSFLQPDIVLFRQNLQALESLNQSHQLYQKDVLRSESLLPQLLTVLFQVLMHRSHALLHEEIATAIFNMAAIDLISFYDQFIVHFLQTIDSIDDQQRQCLKSIFNHEQDLPSFMQNIYRFMNDLRYYQLSNSLKPDV